MPLVEYRRKRNFNATPEPLPKIVLRKRGPSRFVIQKHASTRLHFDFRLELGGTFVSWAVPKGPPLLHGEKRLAVKVEDHPLSYGDFEGVIPKGQYGGGTVQVWDVGTFEALSKNPLKDLKNGKLHFEIKGKKLSGEWYLVRLRDPDHWLLIRGGPDHEHLTQKLQETSVLTGRTMRQIAKAAAPEITVIKTRVSKRHSNKNPREVGKIRSPIESQSPQPATPLAIQDSEFIEPMNAKLVAAPPEGDWEYEIKFDGFRALAYKRGDAVALLSRTNKTLSGRFPEVVKAVQGMDVEEVVIDGEIVALDPAGRSSFQLLQTSERMDQNPPVYYYVFDMLRLNGKGLCRLPIEDRKALLEKHVPQLCDVIRYSPSLGGDARVLTSMARRHGLEGIVGKRAHSQYQPGMRSGAWIKLKLTMEQEFVIGGFTDPAGTRPLLGALLLGYYKAGKLCYAGKVGTGFSTNLLEDLYKRLSGLLRSDCPFSDLPEIRAGRYGQGITASMMKNCHWVQPVTVAQVKFTEWTRDGRLRQPVFVAVREDKPPKNVTRETPS